MGLNRSLLYARELRREVACHGTIHKRGYCALKAAGVIQLLEFRALEIYSGPKTISSMDLHTVQKVKQGMQKKRQQGKKNAKAKEW